jgi:8-oxo-dGTP pyrophosphatase MutT (NUDIX family)
LSDETGDLPHAAGCVVYRYDERGAPLLLLIKDQYGYWTLPKGHLDPGEDAPTAAAREVREETGVAGALGPFVGEIRYPVTTRKGREYVKRVAFFLMRAGGAEVTPQADEGIAEAGWFPPEEALARNGYPDMQGLLADAIRLIETQTRD